MGSVEPNLVFEKIGQNDSVIQMIKDHSIRVMNLSTKLAEMVGVNDYDMKLASLLHDIGKIGVSKEILLKPSKLNELEFTVMKSHSHIGNLIVRNVMNNPKAAAYIRDHHERWDGKGYPRGIKDNEISIQGRIINICDAFDTMTKEQRVYKNRNLRTEEALEELNNCSWKQFDGDLVKYFIDMIYKR